MGKFVYIPTLPGLDDEQKQKLLNTQFLRVFKGLVYLIINLVIFLLLALLPILLLSYLFLGDWLSIGVWFTDWIFVLGTFIGIWPGVLLHKRLKKNEKVNVEDYSAFAQFLHYFFLGNSFIAKAQFIIWKKIKSRESKNTSNQAVYVSGLARAGTTAMMKKLGESDLFNSIRYQDLPLLFYPGMNDSLNTKNEEKERFHQDGVTHSLSSYEALEEPFWRVYCPAYINDTYLENHAITDSIYKKYSAFRNAYSKGRIYLSKNNNHVLRMNDLMKLDQKHGVNHKVILMFRYPSSQASSLLKQHQFLIKEQESNPFVKDYMDMLVHFEFGLSRKQSIFNDSELMPNKDWDQTETWVEYWHYYYSNLLELFRDNSRVCFVCYERFCTNPEESFEAISRFLEKDLDVETKPYLASRSKEDVQVNYKALELYNDLCSIAIN
ncbi:hypothetical protein GYB22_09300 [bacterium]|nr:hypothetical protein [bacterium]